MAAASKGNGAGIALAVPVGVPVLLLWLLWALFVGTMVYSAVVATATVAGNG